VSTTKERRAKGGNGGGARWVTVRKERKGVKAELELVVKGRHGGA